MADFSLLITIGLIFMITLIGAYLRSRRKDRCLNAWQGFHITLERASGKLIWGVLKLESTGMELAYLDSIQDEKHIESSYLLYASEYGDIQALYRYADRLSEWGKQQRTKDIQRSFHPGPLHRLGRATRNFVSTAGDSLNEVFGLVLGRVQKTGGRYLSADGGAAIRNLSGKVFGQVGSLYDPLLEHYIGRRVVIELLEGAEVHEHVGIFKDYSADFVEILDIQFPQDQAVTLTTDMTFESESICVSVFGDKLRITNDDPRPILIRSLHSSDPAKQGSDPAEQTIDAVVDTGETIELHLGERTPDQLRLNMQVVRELDMIVPRTRCIVRHSAENFRAEDLSNLVTEIVFDVGRAFVHDNKPGDREIRLRNELQQNPKDAIAAANLGLLLMQQDNLAEAEQWLRRALALEYSLPDGGRRVRMQLREIERRQSEDASALFGAGQLRPTTPTGDAVESTQQSGFSD